MSLSSGAMWDHGSYDDRVIHFMIVLSTGDANQYDALS